MGMRAAAVELRIEELVLHGVSRRDAERVRDALAAALTAMLESRGRFGSAHSATLDRLDGGVVYVTAGGGASRLGASLADAVYRSVEHAAVGTVMPGSKV
jgi:hypothetical protein